ncbi:MAG: PKD domain-containing protein [Chloroflexota bacterium]
MKYAYQDASGWHFEIVESNGYGPCGDQTSLVLDASGYPHIAYCRDQDSPGLRYAYKDSGGWHTMTIDSGLYEGKRASLALTDLGEPHFSYFDGFNYQLKYAYYDHDDGWHFSTLETGLDRDSGYTSLVLDDVGYPHISYHDDSVGQIKYMYQDISGWHTRILDPNGGTGKSYTSLQLDGNGYPHISYYADGSDKLMYTYQDSTGWYSQTIESGSGEFNSLALDGDEFPHISYGINIYGGDLKYAYYNPKPSGDFTANPMTGTHPLTVTFTALISGTVDSWLWDFGDGGTVSTGPVVSHTYMISDTFDISLTISNTYGSFVVNKPDYIVIRDNDDRSNFVYIPLILNSSP